MQGQEDGRGEKTAAWLHAELHTNTIYHQLLAAQSASSLQSCCLQTDVTSHLPWSSVGAPCLLAGVVEEIQILCPREALCGLSWSCELG